MSGNNKKGGMTPFKPGQVSKVAGSGITSNPTVPSKLSLSANVNISSELPRQIKISDIQKHVAMRRDLCDATESRFKTEYRREFVILEKFDAKLRELQAKLADLETKPLTESYTAKTRKRARQKIQQEYNKLVTSKDAIEANNLIAAARSELQQDYYDCQVMENYLSLVETLDGYINKTIDVEQLESELQEEEKKLQTRSDTVIYPEAPDVIATRDKVRTLRQKINFINEARQAGGTERAKQYMDKWLLKDFLANVKYLEDKLEADPENVAVKNEIAKYLKEHSVERFLAEKLTTHTVSIDPGMPRLPEDASKLQRGLFALGHFLDITSHLHGLAFNAAQGFVSSISEAQTAKTRALATTYTGTRKYLITMRDTSGDNAVTTLSTQILNAAQNSGRRLAESDVIKFNQPKLLMALESGSITSAVLTEEEAAALKKNPSLIVEENSPTWIDEDFSTIVDKIGYMWHLDAVDGRRDQKMYRDPLPANLPPIYAYVIDTPIDLNHQEFVRAGKKIISQGKNFIEGTNLDQSLVKNSHGTHVAATICGREVGVAKNVASCFLVSLPAITTDGGAMEYLVNAVNEAVADCLQRRKSDPRTQCVINMSVRGPGSQAMDSAISDARKKGILVVAAAGNDGSNACIFSPARAPAALTVGGIDADDTPYEYTNSGTCVEFYKPAVNIISAMPFGLYGAKSGTSMATPGAAGDVVDMFARGLNANDVENRITRSLELVRGVINEDCEQDNLVTKTFYMRNPKILNNIEAQAGEISLGSWLPMQDVFGGKAPTTRWDFKFEARASNVPAWVDQNSFSVLLSTDKINANLPSFAPSGCVDDFSTLEIVFDAETGIQLNTYRGSTSNTISVYKGNKALPQNAVLKKNQDTTYWVSLDMPPANGGFVRLRVGAGADPDSGTVLFDDNVYNLFFKSRQPAYIGFGGSNTNVDVSAKNVRSFDSVITPSTSQPTARITAEPTVRETPVPTARITPQPTVRTTSEPTPKITPQPTVKTTTQLTARPTNQPTLFPTDQPIQFTAKPTRATAKPTAQPTEDNGLANDGKPLSWNTEKIVLRTAPTKVVVARNENLDAIIWLEFTDKSGDKVNLGLSALYGLVTLSKAKKNSQRKVVALSSQSDLLNLSLTADDSTLRNIQAILRQRGKPELSFSTVAAGTSAAVTVTVKNGDRPATAFTLRRVKKNTQLSIGSNLVKGSLGFSIIKPATKNPTTTPPTAEPANFESVLRVAQGLTNNSRLKNQITPEVRRNVANALPDSARLMISGQVADYLKKQKLPVKYRPLVAKIKAVISDPKNNIFGAGHDAQDKAIVINYLEKMLILITTAKNANGVYEPEFKRLVNRLVSGNYGSENYAKASILLAFCEGPKIGVYPTIDSLFNEINNPKYNYLEAIERLLTFWHREKVIAFDILGVSETSEIEYESTQNNTNISTQSPTYTPTFDPTLPKLPTAVTSGAVSAFGNSYLGKMWGMLAYPFENREAEDNSHKQPRTKR